MQTRIPYRDAIATVLRNRQFRFLWIGQIFSQLAVNMMLFTLALLVYQKTTSNAAVSGLFLAYGIPSVFFGLIAGVIVNHFDKRFVLLSCDFARSMLVIGLLFVHHNQWLVYFFVFINALLTQFYVPAEAPTIPRLVPPDQLVPANSLFSFTYYSSMAVGFILAGPLLRFAGPSITFGTISGLFLLAVFSISRLSQQPGDRSFGRILRMDIIHVFRRVFEDLGAGVRYATRSRVLSDALLLLTGTQIIIAMLGTLGPGFADRVLEIDVRDASLVITAPVVVGIILGALWVGSVGAKWTPRKLIQVGVVGAGAALILLSLVVRLSSAMSVSRLFDSFLRLPIALVLFFLLGVFNSFLDVPANSILQKEAKGDMRSRVYGILTAAVGGVGILPVIVGGVLADVIGVGKVIFFLGMGVVAYGVYRVRYNKA